MNLQVFGLPAFFRGHCVLGYEQIISNSGFVFTFLEQFIQVAVARGGGMGNPVEKTTTTRIKIISLSLLRRPDEPEELGVIRHPGQVESVGLRHRGR